MDRRSFLLDTMTYFRKEYRSECCGRQARNLALRGTEDVFRGILAADVDESDILSHV